MRSVIFILFLSLVLLFSVSCDQDVVTANTSDTGLSKLDIEINVPKALYDINAAEVVKYEYAATFYSGPTETYSDGNTDVFGECSWTQFYPDEYLKCSLGYFTQGKWHLEIRGVNSNGDAVITGRCDLWITKLTENFARVTLLMRPEGPSTYLDIDITTPALEGEKSDYRMRCFVTPVSYADDGSEITTGTREELSLDWTATLLSNNSMRFRALTDSYSNGIYRVELELAGPDNLHIAGQSLLIPMVSGTPTLIRGELEGGAYIYVTLGLNEDQTEPLGYIVGEIVRSDVTGNRGSVNVEVGVNTALSYIQTAGNADSTYIVYWFVDGVLSGTGTSWIYRASSAGQHEITVVVYNEDGQKTGSAQVLAFAEDPQ